MESLLVSTHRCPFSRELPCRPDTRLRTVQTRNNDAHEELEVTATSPGNLNPVEFQSPTAAFVKTWPLEEQKR